MTHTEYKEKLQTLRASYITALCSKDFVNATSLLVTIGNLERGYPEFQI